MRRVFIHGSGRRGHDAWPRIAAEDGTFVSFADGSTIDEQAAQLVRDFGGADAVVFAHSIGAVPAVLAAPAMQPTALVLVEPALYDIARGDASVERHIAIVSEARDQSHHGDLRAFWGILRPLMFGGPFDPATWERERPVAERWARTNLPWGHGVRLRLLDGIPTLVVTGGWNDEYETIATVLQGEGAEHVVLSGAQHRPMDLPEFERVVQEFVADLG